jgi:hypothetical protein
MLIKPGPPYPQKAGWDAITLELLGLVVFLGKFSSYID